MKWLTDIQDYLKKGDQLRRLILANALVFVAVHIYLLAFYLLRERAPLGEDMYLATSANAQVLIRRPWSFITYMFTHVEFGHFLLNMIMLYVCGKIFRKFHRQRNLTTLYILSGISGFLFYFGFYNLFRPEEISTMLGASAAVMGIVIAAIVLHPEEEVMFLGIFPIRLMWLGIILVLADLVSIRSGFNSGGHVAHLGGAFFGLIYARRLKQGKAVATWFDRFLDKLGSLFRRKNGFEVKRSNPRMKTDDEFNTERVNRQRRVDQILDKIGRSGYDSLTKEEREFLFRHSQK